MSASLRKPTVLLVESTVREPDPAQWARIQERFQLLRYDCGDEEEFCARLQPGGPYAGIEAILRVGWLKAGPYAGHQLFRGRPVTCYPPSLKVICCTGHGYDAADVPALTARGILYANSPDTCTEAVANTALYLILGSYRYFSLAEQALRTERWAESRQLGPVAVDPIGQVLGIVGLGAIGGAIARKAALGLGMQVHYHNRRPCAPATLQRLLGTAALDPAAVTYHDSLASLLRVADCVCLACPLTPETQQLMGAAQFAVARQHRPQGIRLVNIARGGLVDEEALVAAVEAGTVTGWAWTCMRGSRTGCGRSCATTAGRRCCRTLASARGRAGATLTR